MSFQIEINEKIVTVKLENRKNMKHCYMRILKDDLIQIRANAYFTIYDAKKLVRTMETWVTTSVKQGVISPTEGKEFLAIYRSGLYGYTYLE